MSPFASPSVFRHDSWLRHTKLDRQLEDRGLARVGSRDDPGGRRGAWLSSLNPSASRMPSAEGVGILDRRIARAQASVSARKTTSPAIQGSPHGLTHPTYPSAPMVPVGPGSGAVLAAPGKPATSRRRRTETSAIAMPARTIRKTRVFDIHPPYPSAPMVPVGPGSGAVLAALGKPATSRRRRTETSAIAMPARTIRKTRVFDISRT
jgi:hypothetical protein